MAPSSGGAGRAALPYTRARMTTSAPVAPLSPRTRAIGGALIVVFVALVACTNVANALYASWITDHPARLIALSSRNRYLAATAVEHLGWWHWTVIATVRLALAATVCHLLGRIYGDRALRWFWKFLGMTPDGVAAFEQGFERAEWVLVPFFVGSNIVWAISGAARSNPARLAGLFVVGLAARLALIWWLAHRFESQLHSVTTWLNRYQLPIIIASIALVLVVNVRNFRRGR